MIDIYAQLPAIHAQQNLERHRAVMRELVSAGIAYREAKEAYQNNRRRKVAMSFHEELCKAYQRLLTAENHALDLIGRKEA